MLITLAFRHLLVRKIRSALLLLGFALGVGVMIVLLSVGEAMLAQSRDVSLVGGGEVTVLPQGIDIEAMRTGGVSGMFFGIERARFVGRQLLGGPRWSGMVRAVAPAIENKLLYVGRGDRVLPVHASGEIPSRARAVGAALDVVAGTWQDSPADSAWVVPTRQQLYDQMDHFHLPLHLPHAAAPSGQRNRAGDSTWAEWHYFNIAVSPAEWWYITFLVGGDVPDGRWGGQLLVTRRRPDGRYERFTTAVSARRTTLDTTRADLLLGESFVHQRDGVYYLSAQGRGDGGRVLIDVAVRPAPHRYFPPVELREEEFLSGYVVPGLVASATGKLCVASRCTRVKDAAAYHDHNWGVWRGVTWEWGTARGAERALLYGGVYTDADSGAAGGSPFFLAVVDSVGLKQVLRFRRIAYSGTRPAKGAAGATAPARFTLEATRDADSVRLDVTVQDALATEMGAKGFRRYFLQMRGRFGLTGRVLGEAVADSGQGFFETYVGTRSSPSTSAR